MTRNEKKTAIENMAERFMSISDLEGKSMAIPQRGAMRTSAVVLSEDSHIM